MTTNEILRKMLDVLTEEEKKILFSDLESKEVDDSEISERVKDVLLELGVPSHFKGYVYLQDAIEIVSKQGISVMGNVISQIYTKIAEKYDATPGKVERCIRHAIEVGANRGDPNAYDRYFGSTTDPKKGKATNSEFIFRIAEVIRK